MKIIEVNIRDENTQAFKTNKVELAKKLGVDSVTDTQYLNVAMSMLDKFLGLSGGDNLAVVNTEQKTFVKIKIPLL